MWYLLIVSHLEVPNIHLVLTGDANVDGSGLVLSEFSRV